ncbi:unnamed protein product [Oncorhynchus mykiss]|uniref:Spermatogenesis-associated protein 2 PUB-like domain-containing protein n=1 Tax=Oncorhynchus mykiss TaxID=8022 RepID=A0A060XC51_ONCMY|nr:unnamed protein product [Oncorhynchus mykiss]
MDAKLQEDLFRRYVACLERRLEDGGGNAGPGRGTSQRGSEALLSTATALLGAYQPDPGQRFRMVRFYEVVENAMRCLRGCSLRGLERAFLTLETVCTNLLLFPWKKEFRCIKTFTGPYVYHLQAVLCDADLRSLLRSMGYSHDHELQFHVRDHPGGPAHLRQLAFELFLAQAECRLLGEVVALARGSASELEALEQRRGCRDDAAGCAEVLRRRDSLGADMARLSVRPVDIGHPHHLRRGGRPSKSVDVTDGAGHWHAASKPVLKASLSLRKEPLFVDAEEDMKDEIIRPSTSISMFSVAAPPSYSPLADFFPIQSPPSVDAYSSYHLSSLDEIDLYTERGGPGVGGRQTPSRPSSREPWDGWVFKAHGGLSSLGVKCQGCGLGCSNLASCPRCDMILCPALYSNTHSPHPHMHPHPLTLTQQHTHPHPQMVEKPLMATKLLGGSRCGFCNKPGASHTCVNCSKVSCDSCMSLYGKDLCTRKNPQHSFVPNHQLNFKSGTISHLVYR